MNVDNKELGQLLSKARKSKNIKQQTIADKSGFTKNYVSTIERGLCKCNIFILLAYADALDMPIDTILGRPLKQDSIDPELLKILIDMSESDQKKLVAMLSLNSLDWSKDADKVSDILKALIEKLAEKKSKNKDKK